jgi:hypothetical protein
MMEVTLPREVPYRVVPRGRLAELTLELKVKIEN